MTLTFNFVCERFEAVSSTEKECVLPLLLFVCFFPIKNKDSSIEILQKGCFSSDEKIGFRLKSPSLKKGFCM